MIDQNKSHQGRTGWIAKLSVLAVSATFCFLMAPASALGATPDQNSSAGTLELGGSPDEYSTSSMTGDHYVTQLDFIKWFVALSGDTPLFDELSTVGDYVYWARKMKMKPKGGWHPDDVLTQDMFAELLADVFKIKVLNKDDAKEVFIREGITLPDEDIITWDGLVSVVDDTGFQSRLSIFAHGLCSPIEGEKYKITNKKCTPPPPPVGDDAKRRFRSFKEKKVK